MELLKLINMCGVLTRETELTCTPLDSVITLDVDDSYHCTEIELNKDQIKQLRDYLGEFLRR